MCSGPANPVSWSLALSKKKTGLMSQSCDSAWVLICLAGGAPWLTEHKMKTGRAV